VNPSFADIAKKMGAFGVSVDRAEDIQDAVKSAMLKDQPSVVEIHVNSEVLNEPYRRDALKYPVRVTEKYAMYSNIRA
jgi:sulfoacetaldehyde acetyltransferase